MKATDLRSYGPGKFQLVIDEVPYMLSMDGCDEECGDVAANGWYGLLRGPIEVCATARLDLGLTDAEVEYLTSQKGGCIVSEDGHGFVTVTYYTDPFDLAIDWKSCQQEAGEGGA